MSGPNKLDHGGPYGGGPVALPVTSAAPSGAAGGDLAGTYPNPTLAVDRIEKSVLTANGDLLTRTAGVPARIAVDPVAGHVLTSDGSAWAGAAPSTGSTAPWSLAAKPIVPDARDEEFEGTAFAGWTDLGTRSATAIDPNASFTTVSTYRHSWNVRRPGWLIIQPNTGGSASGIYKQTTLNTNDLIKCRIMQQGVPNGDASVSILISDDLAFTHMVYVNVRWGTSSPTCIVYNDATATTVNVGSTLVGGVTAGTSLLNYIGILKIGNQWSIYLGTESGSWTHIVTVTNANITATPYITLRVYGPTGASAPGNPIMGYSGLEFFANATDLR